MDGSALGTDPMDTLLDPEAAGLLRAARGGADTQHVLRVKDLEPGAVGVLEVVVRQVEPVRTFRRRNGGEGLRCRVLLGDGTGDVPLTLWDGETAQVRDGPFLPGARLRLRGAPVKAGFRGGVELGLGSAVVEPVQEQATTDLAGILESIGDTEVVGTPPHTRFKALLAMETDDGTSCQVMLWDEAVRQARGLLPGARIRVVGVQPHPALEGHYVGTPETTVALAATVK